MTLPSYRTHPMHTIPGLDVQESYDALAAGVLRHVGSAVAGHVVVVDGFSGTLWSEFVTSLRIALERVGIVAAWYSTESCFLAPARIADLLAPFLTDDPVFGRHCCAHLEELWDSGALAALQGAVREQSRLSVVYGFGASLVTRGDLLVYVDVPKDRGQTLAVQGLVTNIGAAAHAPFGTMYKQLYFVDWPMLNRIKRALLPDLDILVDLADVESPRFITGPAFRRSLQALSQTPFRVKPWFAPGPWAASG